MSDAPIILGRDHLPIRVGSRVRHVNSYESVGTVTRITELDLGSPIRVVVRWDGEPGEDDNAVAERVSEFSHYYAEELVQP